MSDPSTPPPPEHSYLAPEATPSPSASPTSQATPSSPIHTPSSSASNTPTSSGKKRPRGSYNCGKCGLRKRGHSCTASTSGAQDGAASASIPAAGGVTFKPSVPHTSPASALPSDASAVVYSTQYPSSQLTLASENEKLKAEVENMKKLLQTITEQHNDARHKLFLYETNAAAPSSTSASTFAPPTHDILSSYNKANLVPEMPEFVNGDLVVAGENGASSSSSNNNNTIPSSSSSSSNTTPPPSASDLNDLSNVAQQIGTRPPSEQPQQQQHPQQ